MLWRITQIFIVITAWVRQYRAVEFHLILQHQADFAIRLSPQQQVTGRGLRPTQAVAGRSRHSYLMPAGQITKWVPYLVLHLACTSARPRFKTRACGTGTTGSTQVRILATKWNMAELVWGTRPGLSTGAKMTLISQSCDTLLNSAYSTNSLPAKLSPSEDKHFDVGQ